MNPPQLQQPPCVTPELVAQQEGWTPFGSLSADKVVPLLKKFPVTFEIDGEKTILGALSVRAFGPNNTFQTVLTISFIGAPGRRSAEICVLVPFSKQKLLDAEWGDTGAIGPNGSEIQLSLVAIVNFLGAVLISLWYIQGINDAPDQVLLSAASVEDDIIVLGDFARE